MLVRGAVKRVLIAAAAGVLLVGCGSSSSGTFGLAAATGPTPEATHAPELAGTAEASPTPKPTATKTPKPTPTKRAVVKPKPKPTPTKTVAPPSDCDPSYPDQCLHDGIGDYDCSSGSGNGPNYAYGPLAVVGSDPFGLDRDGDGVGCENG